MSASRMAASRRPRRVCGNDSLVSIICVHTVMRTPSPGMGASSAPIPTPPLRGGVKSAVVARCRRARHVARSNVRVDLRARPPARVAPPAAAGGAEGETVAGRKRNAGCLAQVLAAAVRARHHGFIDGSGRPTMQAPRRILGALAIHIGNAVPQRAIGEFDAEPAAMLAGPAGVRAQRELLNEDWI